MSMKKDFLIIIIVFFILTGFSAALVPIGVPFIVISVICLVEAYLLQKFWNKYIKDKDE